MGNSKRVRLRLMVGKEAGDLSYWGLAALGRNWG